MAGAPLKVGGAGEMWRPAYAAANGAGCADWAGEMWRPADADAELEAFLLRVFDHFGVGVEDLGERTYLLRGHGVTTDSFPEIPSDGLVGTFNRPHALGREDVSLLSSDHPMVTGAVDLLLGSEQGNCSFGVWADKADKTLMLETVFVLEALAPARLHADRFLPPMPLRVLVNHKNESLEPDESVSELSSIASAAPVPPDEMWLAYIQIPPRMEKCLPRLHPFVLARTRRRSPGTVRRATLDLSTMSL